MPSSFEGLTDEEIAGELRRRKAARQPKKFRVYEVDEDTFHKLLGTNGVTEIDDEDDGEDDDEELGEGDEEEEDEPAPKPRRASAAAKKRGYFER